MSAMSHNNWSMPVTVRISSYGRTWKARGALTKQELLSAAPIGILMLLLCSSNFPQTSIPIPTSMYAH